MAALVSYARKLEPLPERYRAVADDAFAVPECQTPVRVFPEVRRDACTFTPTSTCGNLRRWRHFSPSSSVP